MIAGHDPIEAFVYRVFAAFKRPKPERPEPPPIIPRRIPPPPRKPSPRRLTDKQKALSDLLDRLAYGETIPSQEALVIEWGRPKQTVSDWMKEWRRIGVIPAATKTGRCKATIPA